jgi:hypothetical protein
MCQIAKQLLVEKLIDDFYDEHGFIGQSANTENFMEWVKTVLPAEQLDLLYRWEAAYAERCGEELRQFADFVAGILMRGASR